MALAIGHVMNLCLSSSSIIVQKKHVPFDIRICSKAIAKGSPNHRRPKVAPLHEMEDENVILHLKSTLSFNPLGNVPCVQNLLR